MYDFYQPTFLNLILGETKIPFNKLGYCCKFELTSYEIKDCSDSGLIMTRQGCNGRLVRVRA